LLLCLLYELPQLLRMLLLNSSKKVLRLQRVDIGETLRILQQVWIATHVHIVIATGADARRLGWNLGVLELVEYVAVSHGNALATCWQQVQMA